MAKQPDVLDALALFVRGAHFKQIPERVVALAKLHIIDAIGVMVAGAAAPATIALGHPLERNSGEAEIVGTAHAVGAARAAFANALSGRVLDFDDVQTTESSIYGLLAHPSVPVMAASLAVAQMRNVSGAALLTAYLIGVEAATRLANAAEAKRLHEGLATTAIFGGVGALLAAAKLLDLEPKAIRAALALWDATTGQARHARDGALTAALRDAHAVRAAVEVALLASGGVADDVPMSARSTLVAMPKTAVKNLGDPFGILEPGFAVRVYPCQPLLHPALDLVLAVVNLHDLRAEAIERIEIGVTRPMAATLLLDAPTHVAELRRSLPFAAALAASKGVVVPDDFVRLPKARNLRALMGRVHCRVDPALDALGAERARTIVRVTVKGGRVIQMKADVAKGTPQKPLSEIELFHKFFQCALPTLGDAGAERLLNRLWLLDEVPSVKGLCRLDVPWPTDVVPGSEGYRRHDYDHDEAHGRGHHAHLGHDDPRHSHYHAHDHGKRQEKAARARRDRMKQQRSRAK